MSMVWKWLYNKLEFYFVRRWWERWIYERMKAIWEEGETPDEIGIPREVKHFFCKSTPSVNNINTIDVYESSWGTSRIKWE